MTARKIVAIRLSLEGIAAVQRLADRDRITWSEAARKALAEGVRSLTDAPPRTSD